MKKRPDTVILWDVHEVLFTRNIAHWFYVCITYQKKWAVLRSIDWHILMLGFRYLMHIMHIRRAELSSQELIDYARQKNKQALIELAVRVACDYRPILGTIALIKRLHDLGYRQDIASNIGPTVLGTFDTMYPEIFSYFTYIQAVFYAHNRLIKKPNPDFFKHYCITNNLDPARIIFIDDKQYNVDAARACGMTALQFQTVHKLERDLQMLLPF